MSLKQIFENNENVTGITMWDEKNNQAIIRCLKTDEILIEDLIHKLGLTLIKTTGGFNNPEKNMIIGGI